MRKAIFALALIGVLVLAGCAQNQEQRAPDTYPQYQSAIGGGCGVAAPAEPTGIIADIGRVPAA